MKPGRWLLPALLILGACPTKKWILEPPVMPPAAKDSNTKRIITVTASREPEVNVERKGGGGWEPGTPIDPVTWPGTGRYLIEAHQQLGRVSITQSCGSGCNECIPPRDGSEYIRIERAETLYGP